MSTVLSKLTTQQAHQGGFTCPIAPNQTDFKADTAAPGYRWLELHPDGRIESGVSRVTEIVFDVDTESGGYL